MTDTSEISVASHTLPLSSLWCSLVWVARRLLPLSPVTGISVDAREAGQALCEGTALLSSDSTRGR